MQIEEQNELCDQNSAFVLIFEIQIRKIEQIIKTGRQNSLLNGVSQLRFNFLSRRIHDTKNEISYVYVKDTLNKIHRLIELRRLTFKQSAFLKISSSKGVNKKIHGVPEALVRFLEDQKLAKYQKETDRIKAAEESETKLVISRLGQLDKMILEEVEK